VVIPNSPGPALIRDVAAAGDAPVQEHRLQHGVRLGAQRRTGH
jgi:hypothetical protein